MSYSKESRSSCGDDHVLSAGDLVRQLRRDSPVKNVLEGDE